MNDAPSEPNPWWEGDYVWRPQEVPDEPVEELDSSPPRRGLVPCWHCGKLVEQETTVCIFCRAPLGGGDLPPVPLRSDLEDGGLKDRLRLRPALLPMLGFYVALLLLTLGFMILTRLLVKKRTFQNPAESLLWLTVLVELVSTLLVVLAVVRVPRPPRLKKQSIEARTVAWVCGVPALAFLLGLNLFYHAALHEVVGQPAPPEVVMEFSPLHWLLICVQPAVVEELFFRYLALGTLRRYMGLHWAVLVSSAMFGVAHVGMPLSMPLLALVGVGLGYLRVYSNGLALPMLVHFAHNLMSLLIAMGF